MITIISSEELPQGGEDWAELRKHFISATDAFGLLQGKTIQELLEAKATNSFTGNYWTARGKTLEPVAKEIYSELYEPTTDVGFIINDRFPHVGFSPDGVVGKDGLVEVKSFGRKHHLAMMEKVDPHVYAQIQYQLWVSERKWNDLILFNPDLEDLDKTFRVERFYPDKDMHQKFKDIFSSQKGDKQ